MSVLSAIIRKIDGIITPDTCPLCMERECIEGEGCCLECLVKLPQPHHRCRICGGENTGYLEICRNCQEEEARVWYQGVTAFNYTGDIRDAVHRFKYNSQAYLSRFFALQMARAWKEHSQYFKADMITPVPLYWTRRLIRGYNQAELLVNGISKLTGIPKEITLRKVHSTGHQARKNSRMRHVNLRGAFQVRDEAVIKGKNILLVDDVFTTGSTLNEAARTLKKHGAADICVLTIARDL